MNIKRECTYGGLAGLVASDEILINRDNRIRHETYNSPTNAGEASSIVR